VAQLRADLTVGVNEDAPATRGSLS
jgi:hypothetical protein